MHPSTAPTTRSGQLCAYYVRRLKQITGNPHQPPALSDPPLPETYRRLLAKAYRKTTLWASAGRVGFRQEYHALPLGATSDDRSSGTEDIPFAAMDVALRCHMALPRTGSARLEELCRQSRAVGGIFITLAVTIVPLPRKHGWEGWKPIYEKILLYAREPVKIYGICV